MIRLVDAILCLVLLEAAALVLLRRRTGLPPRAVLSTLAAGFCLLLGIRLALAGAAAVTLCAVLFLALCAHGADLWVRWRR